MAYKYKLKEEEGAEVTPSNREQVNYDVVLTPKSSEVEDVVKALETMDNYGMYVSNMRNKSNIQKAIEDYFGPVIPAKRKQIEKQRGVPFPVKTKQAIDDLVKSLTSKPSLLKYKVVDNTIVFPKSSNPVKDLTKKIIDVVMKNAKIDYSVAEKETVDEIINEETRNISNIKKKLDDLGVKYEISTNKVKPFKVIYKPVNKSDEFYNKFDNIVDLFNLKDVVKSSMNEDKLDQEAKIYFMQQVKQGKIKELPKDPKAEYMKIKMSKDKLKEIIREKLQKLTK
jgi:hypothetical protein